MVSHADPGEQARQRAEGGVDVVAGRRPAPGAADAAVLRHRDDVPLQRQRVRQRAGVRRS